jgi:hypothetical protein
VVVHHLFVSDQYLGPGLSELKYRQALFPQLRHPVVNILSIYSRENKAGSKYTHRRMYKYHVNNILFIVLQSNVVSSECMPFILK